MRRLLLDVNIAASTARFLREYFGCDVTSVAAQGLMHLSDREISELAAAEERTVLTFDLDFGEIFLRHAYRPTGVIIRRLRDQTAESVNRVLDQFFSTHATVMANTSHLTVVTEKRMRIVS